jgi:RNA polymerase sigma-70 factor (ECF subfamily)
VTDNQAVLAPTPDADSAFRDLVTAHRRELHLHCYRMLGSLQDAEDVVQETLLAAWRGLERFERRASIRTWLYRIATNRCLNALRDRERRPRPIAPAPASMPEPSRYAEPLWLDPYPDAYLDGLADTAPGPQARHEARESIGLAYLTAVQLLPARQRAAVLLRDGLGFSTAEVADTLGGTETAVKGVLQRARSTLRTLLPPTGAGDRAAPAPGTPRERRLASLFAQAVENGDVDGMVALLTDDARLSMPPQPHTYLGRGAIAAFLHDRQTRRGFAFRVVPTRANGRPAFACYGPAADGGPGMPFGIIATTLAHDGDRDRIAALTWFCDTRLFTAFALPGATVPRELREAARE